MTERKIGANMRRLISYKAAQNTNPDGGGIGGAMNALSSALQTPGHMAEIFSDAQKWADEAVNVIRALPDNPYGDDEEAIAGAFLEEIENRKTERLNAMLSGRRMSDGTDPWSGVKD